MNQIRRLMDRINLAESKNAKDVTMPLQDARLLRDEIMTFLLDQKQSKGSTDEVIEVVMRGGSFK
jgi:hypothetical protein